METLSLIQALFLLQREEGGNSIRLKNRKIATIRTTPKRLAEARNLAHSVLGRNLTDLPKQSKILFLLIEEMVEKYCSEKKIELFSVWFTSANIQFHTGWALARIKAHLNHLEKMQYVYRHDHRKTSRYSINRGGASPLGKNEAKSANEAHGSLTMLRRKGCGGQIEENLPLRLVKDDGLLTKTRKEIF